jgi:hypothetical protein
MDISKIKNAMIFGNKGNVWSDQCHASTDKGLLCKTPALSTNWARIEKVTNVGCPECLAYIAKHPSLLK